MRLLNGRLTARTVLIPLMIAADLLALWVGASRPPRIFSDWLGLVGRPEDTPIVRLRAWAGEGNAPRTPSGFISLFETEELVVGGLLVLVLLFLIVLLTVPRSGRWKRLLSTSPLRLLRALPVRFRVHTALTAIAILALYMGWEIEAWKTWRLRDSHLQRAWTAAQQETIRLSSLRSKQEALAKLEADSPPADLSFPELGYYRSKAAVAAERAWTRDRLKRETSYLSAITEAFAERRRKYERAAANPRQAVAPDAPLPEPTRDPTPR
jgi:hypothetical protein